MQEVPLKKGVLVSKIRSGVKWTLIETLTSRLLQMVSTLFVARILGPEAMGLIALVLVSLEVFSVFTQMGIGSAIIYQKKPKPDQLATLYSLNWILAILVYGLIFAVSPYASDFFEMVELEAALKVAALSVIVSAVGQQSIILMSKNLEFRAYSFIFISSSIINTALCIFLVLEDWGFWSIIVAQLISLAVRNIAAFLYGLSRGMFHGFGLDFISVKSMLSYGLYQAGSSLTGLVSSKSDHVVIGKMAGSASLGIYSVASQFTLQVMQKIIAINNRVLFPAISKNQNDILIVKDLYFKSLNNTIIIVAPMFIGLSALSDLAVIALLGPGWDGLENVISLLSVYVLIRCLGSLNNPLVLGLGKAKWAFHWNLLLMLVVPIVVFVGSYLNGVIGVAAGLIMVQSFVVCAAYFYWIKRLLGPCLKDYLETVFRPVLISSSMALMVGYSANSFGPKNPVFSLLFFVFLGACIYIFLSCFLNRKNFKIFIGSFLGKA